MSRSRFADALNVCAYVRYAEGRPLAFKARVGLFPPTRPFGNFRCSTVVVFLQVKPSSGPSINQSKHDPAKSIPHCTSVTFVQSLGERVAVSPAPQSAKVRMTWLCLWRGVGLFLCPLFWPLKLSFSRFSVRFVFRYYCFIKPTVLLCRDLG